MHREANMPYSKLILLCFFLGMQFVDAAHAFCIRPGVNSKKIREPTKQLNFAIGKKSVHKTTWTKPASHEKYLLFFTHTLNLLQRKEASQIQHLLAFLQKCTIAQMGG
jgi:hypothetical protein